MIISASPHSGDFETFYNYTERYICSKDYSSILSINDMQEYNFLIDCLLCGKESFFGK